MIFGIGNDILDINRFESFVSKFDNSRLERVFTKNEIALSLSRKTSKVTFLAGRFAVKEAFAKAVGTGIGEFVKLNEVETIYNDKGKPVVVLHGKTQDFFIETCGDNSNIHVSIAHTITTVTAVIVIEK